MNIQEQEIAVPGFAIFNRFVRGRNILLSEIQGEPLFNELQKHQQQYNIEVPDEISPIFKGLLAAFTLHCASRPRNEVLAWTIRFNDPLCSFFFGGDTELGTVTGRFFTDNIRQGGKNEMYQELKRPGKPLHRSMVDFDGTDASAAVERFYEQSEQRPGKFFDMGDGNYSLMTAHPDYDEGWFTTLDLDTMRNIQEQEETNLLETRIYRWFCGCSKAKICEMLLPMMQEDPENLFRGESEITVNCPRCAATYVISRNEMEELEGIS